jgi:hypothetical protein
MKFIGQYIQDFIARFRSDVYLEDVSSGTIASGGNLGLDSNNKIVKANVPAEHDAVTLAGTPDYITLSGQELTRNQIDLTADVTGTLPVGNTAAKVTSVIAGDGIDVDSTTGDVTVTAETASATNPGVVELATTAETTTGTDTTRAVTPDGLKDGFQGSANIVAVGTITSGAWRGIAIDQTYLVGQSGTNTGDQTSVSGNAGTATALATARDINGVSFDGTGDITVTAAGSTLSDTVTVAKGGTGATTLASNSILTGNGTSAVQAESGLTYESEALVIGDDDNGAAQIKRLRHTDDAGGDLYIRGGDATGTDKAGGALQLFGGRATGNGAGGAVIIQSGETHGSGGVTTLRGTNVIASFRSDGDTLLQGNLIFEGSVPDAHETTFSITNPTADRTITVPDADVDLTKVRAASDTLDGVVELATTAEATTGTDTSRAVTAAGVAAVHATSQTGKHKQIFVQNFVDDLGTDKHFMPFKTNVETTQQYQEESCLIAPFDGRVVSVTIGYAQTQNNPTDITVGVETINSGVSYAGTWTVDETQTETLTGNHHVLHFVFDDAKHFDSTNKIAISIQQAADVQNAERFFWVSTIIEWDYSTALANDEYESTP